MLPIVSLFVLVVFMGVIFADSVDAAIFVSSLNQSNASFGDVLGYPDDDSWNFIARSFTSGTHEHGYVLQGAKIDIESGSSSRNAVVGIYSSGDSINVVDKMLGDKLYDLTGSISSTGVRTFSAPLGAVLNANTTYFLLIQTGSGSGTFRLVTILRSGVDSSSQAGWSMGASLYGRNNGESSFYPGGLKAEIFGINRSANSDQPPVFSGSANFSVNENNRTVGTVVASDGDSQDSVTGYSVSGGADSSRVFDYECWCFEFCFCSEL